MEIDVLHKSYNKILIVSIMNSNIYKHHGSVSSKIYDEFLSVFLSSQSKKRQCNMLIINI